MVGIISGCGGVGGVGVRRRGVCTIVVVAARVALAVVVDAAVDGRVVVVVVGAGQRGQLGA